MNNFMKSDYRKNFQAARNALCVFTGLALGAAIAVHLAKLLQVIS